MKRREEAVSRWGHDPAPALMDDPGNFLALATRAHNTGQALHGNPWDNLLWLDLTEGVKALLRRVATLEKVAHEAERLCLDLTAEDGRCYECGLDGYHEIDCGVGLVRSALDAAQTVHRGAA